VLTAVGNLVRTLRQLGFTGWNTEPVIRTQDVVSADARDVSLFRHLTAYMV